MARYWPLGTGRIVTSPFGPREDGFHAGMQRAIGRLLGIKPVSAVPAGNPLLFPALGGGMEPRPTLSFVFRLFRDGIQFCSGLVDLVVCISHDLGGGRHGLTFAGE